MTGVILLFLTAFITGPKSIVPSPTATWESSLRVVIVEVVMSGRKCEEFLKAVVLVSMPHIECEGDITEQVKFIRCF